MWHSNHRYRYCHTSVEYNCMTRCRETFGGWPLPGVFAWRAAVRLNFPCEHVLPVFTCEVITWRDAPPRYRRAFRVRYEHAVWKLNLARCPWEIHYPLSIFHCPLYDLSITIVHYSIPIDIIISIYQRYAFIPPYPIANGNSSPIESWECDWFYWDIYVDNEWLHETLDMSSSNDRNYRTRYIVEKLWQ